MCHDFYRSRCLSLFGRCSAVAVTGLLAIIDPCLIFHWFCLVFLHTWFQSHSLIVVYLTLCFPSCPCQILFIVMLVIYGLVGDGFLCPRLVYYILWFWSLFYVIKLLHYTKFDSPVPDFPATYTHDMTVSGGRKTQADSLGYKDWLLSSNMVWLLGDLWRICNPFILFQTGLHVLKFEWHFYLKSFEVVLMLVAFTIFALQVAMESK